MSELDFAQECDEAVKEYIKENAIRVKPPKPKGAKGSAMDSCNMNPTMVAHAGTVNQRTLMYFIASSSNIGYYNCALMAQHWLVSKACELKAKDAVKKWFNIGVADGTSLEPNQIKFIEKLNKKYKLKKNLVEAVKFNNVFGIRHILFKHVNPDFDYEKPFNPDDFKDGDYAGMAQIDPNWIVPEIADDDLTDPTSIGFYEPTYWNITGKRYHRSHFVILRGEDVADYLKPTYRYGGISLTQRIYERIYASESTANEGPQLAKTKRLTVQKVDAEEIQSNLPKFIKNLNIFAKFRDNYGTKFIGKNDEVSQIDTNLADLDSTIMTQYQLVCSIAGTPASKLLGTGHGGFSTGETDDDYYIQEVESLQGNEMEEIVEAHYKRLIPSAIEPKINVEPELQTNWNPLKVMSANEIADVRVKNSQADVNWFNTGAVDNIDIRERMIGDEDSGFEGMEALEVMEENDADTEESALDPDQALNGAQVTALTGILEKISTGEMTKETGVKVMLASFPMGEKQAREVVQDVTEGSAEANTDG